MSSLTLSLSDPYYDPSTGLWARSAIYVDEGGSVAGVPLWFSATEITNLPQLEDGRLKLAAGASGGLTGFTIGTTVSGGNPIIGAAVSFVGFLSALTDPLRYAICQSLTELVVEYFGSSSAEHYTTYFDGDAFVVTLPTGNDVNHHYSLLLGSPTDDLIREKEGDIYIVADQGNDIIVASDEGNATVDGGEGVDKINYSSLNSAVDVSLAAGGVYYTTDNTSLPTGGLKNVIENIESIEGTGYADRIEGSFTDNTLSGGNGDDILDGFAGNNVLIGGGGNDQLYGGNGFDTYVLASDGSVDTVIDGDRDGVIQWRGKTTVNLTGEAEYESGDEWSLSKDGVDFKLKVVDGNLEIYVDNTKVSIIQDFVETGKEAHDSEFGKSTYKLSLEDPDDDDDDDSGADLDDTIDEIDNLFSQADQSGHTDPLVLDLDGDGIEVYRNQTVQFDIDGDGQLETVGWIQSDDGFLVRDINANGVIDDINELYGNATQLGFDELREDEALFSQNADSLINAQDGQFYDDLLIWRDLNSDGVSQANELSSLADNGITEIDIRSTSILQDGRWIGNNLISEISFYEDAVNGPQEIAEVFFMMDDPSGSYNQPGNLYEGTDPTVLALPQQRGYGQLASLQGAMENDPTLLSMVQGLSQITDDAGLFRDSVVDILYRWADAEAIDPSSRGGNFDARSLFVMEKLLGRSFGANGDPNGRAVGLLERAFDILVNTIESRFMVQSIFSDIFPHAEYSFLTDSLHLNDDFASVAARLDSSAFSEDIGFVFKIYKILLENQSALGTTTTAINEYLAATLTGIFGDDAFIAQLIASFESDYVVYGEGNFTGTFRDELVISQGHGDTISGGDGQDILLGSSGDDIFTGELIRPPSGGAYQTLSNDTVFGGDGEDTFHTNSVRDALLMGGDGNDTFGQGRLNYSTMVGGDGDDYIRAQGSDNIVLGGAGNDRIHAHNTVMSMVRNFVDLGEGNDTIESGAKYHASTILGGDGDDTFRLSLSGTYVDGGRGNDTITAYGFGGYNTIRGGDGDDVITAQVSNYTIDGGDGNDTIQGSNGHLNVIIGQYANTTDEISVTSYNYNLSHIDITAFTGINYLSDLEVEEISGEDYGWVISLPDNQKIILRSEVNLDLEDFFIFSDVPPSIEETGTSANESLQGDAGADTLDGAGGSDTIYGGNGNDSIIGGDNTSSDGADVLHGEGGDDSIFGGYHHDSLYGGDGNDTLDGGVSNDLLDGGNGDDSLIGGSGNDTLIGGAGMDTFVGGTGNDVITVEVDDYLVVDAGGGADIVNGSAASDTIIGGDNSSSDGADELHGHDGDDSIFGGYHHDSLYGGEGNDTLDGGVSNDLLDGGNGDDSLIGGSGNDTLIGGAGMDTFVGGTGNDVITVEVDDYLVVDAGGGADIVNGSAANDTIIGGDNSSADGADVLYGNDGDDSIFGGYHHDSLYGGDGNDTLDGGVSNDLLDGGNGDDSLIGGSGNDTLIGGAGMDTFVGGTGNDVITVEVDDYLVVDAGGGADTVNGSALGDTIIGGDNSSADGADVLYGNDGDDSIFGGYHHDSLYGGDGNDTLDGGVSNDLLDGGNGDDSLIGGAGNDTLIGGAGMDTFVGGTGDDVITVEADDYLVVDAGGGADVVHGSSANDTIIGGENNSSDGQDVLYGNDGDDSIFGGYHHDQLFGGSGADTLDGGVSHDTLDGGMGADLLTGGAGDDIFVFSDLLHSTTTAQDTIADFTQGNDHIDLTALGFTGIQSGVADGDMLGFSVVGGNTVIEADNSDFSIVLTGDITLTNDDFVF